MPINKDLSVMILVKAAPVLTSDLEETMCVAAMTLDSNPKWIRLHPVPFRDLDDESKFRKYQEVTVDVIRSSQDRRPESWVPIAGSIRLGQWIGTDMEWAERRARIDKLEERTTCDLIKRNKLGSGPETPSLGIVRTAGKPRLVITRREQIQIDDWKKRAEGIEARTSLFDDPKIRKNIYEMCPWRFRYSYNCLEDSCTGHIQTIVDWEAAVLWHKVKREYDWQRRMEQKFIDEIWAADRDTRLFIGNMNQHPRNFLILGVFWPPKTPYMHQKLFGK